MTYGFTIHYDVVLKIKILIDKEDGSTGKSKFTVHEETLEFEKVYLGISNNVTVKYVCITRIRF